MFGKKKKGEKKKDNEAAKYREMQRGLLFWLPGGSSRLDVYLDYCVIRCLGKTKMKEKERKIPFTSIKDVVYTPGTGVRYANLQLITKEMPNVKQSYWYAYENNLVVVHPSTEEIAHKVREYILDPEGSNVVPADYLNQLKEERSGEETQTPESMEADPAEDPEKAEPVRKRRFRLRKKTDGKKRRFPIRRQ